MAGIVFGTASLRGSQVMPAIDDDPARLGRILQEFGGGNQGGVGHGVQ
jgi:hypothetical protein